MSIETLISHCPDRRFSYPASCTTTEQKQEWERGFIKSGLPLPSIDRLPEEMTLVRAEWHRRAES